MKKQYTWVFIVFLLGLIFLPSTLYAKEEGQDIIVVANSKVSDIIGPIKKEEEQEEYEERLLPNEEDLNFNEDFKPYNPHYPEKERYGDYTLRVPELKGRLSFYRGKGKQLIGSLFAPGVSKTSGWKDATKQWGNIDSALCFAASSSNLISWYLEEYKKLNKDMELTYVTEVEEIFNRFRRGWVNEGGDQKEALSWYFTGGFPSGNNQPDDRLTGKETGGYLRNKIANNTSSRWADVSFYWQPKEVFTVYGGYDDDKFPFLEELGGHTGDGAISTLEKFSAQILRQLHYGACSISIIKDTTMGGAGHAITLWGADYDVDTGLVTGIYVTDSDDNRRLFRVAVEKSKGELAGNNDGVSLVKYPYHAQGDSRPYTKIRDSVLLYAPGVVIRDQEYEGGKVEIEKIGPSSDGQGVEVNAIGIPGKTLEYGYSYDKNVSNVIYWQDENYFEGLEAGSYYFFARVKNQAGVGAGGESDPSHYRVKLLPPISKDEYSLFSLGTEIFQPSGEAEQYIWYGKEGDKNENKSDEAILWRVLDVETNKGNEGLFLLATKLFGEKNNGKISFADRAPYNNEYLSSNLRKLCKRFEYEHMTEEELKAILTTTKSDKIFSPSSEEIITSLTTDSSRMAKYRGNYSDYWLRPLANQQGAYAPYVNDEGRILSKSTIQEAAVRPAFYLDKNQIAYVMAVGNRPFSNSLGLEKNKLVNACDFRLILKDKDRLFNVTTEEIVGQAGGLVSFSYEGAKVSHDNNEYISIFLLDADEKLIYYGKVATVDNSDGSVNFLLPNELENGNYKLKVFNEEYKGERETSRASDFCDIKLTINTIQKVEPIEKVDLMVEKPVTGQEPKDAKINGDKYYLVNTIWTPNHNVFKPETKYSVSVVLKAKENYIFTSNSEFILNGQRLIPKTNGDEYIVVYDDFAKTSKDTKEDNVIPEEETSANKDSSTSNSPSAPSSNIKKEEAFDDTSTERLFFPSGDKLTKKTTKDGERILNFEKKDGSSANIVENKNGNIKVKIMISSKAEQESKKTGKPFELGLDSKLFSINPEKLNTIHIKTETGEKIKLVLPVTKINSKTVLAKIDLDKKEEIIGKTTISTEGIRFIADSGVNVKIFNKNNFFSDIKGHWAQDSIDFVTSRNLYKGISKTKFSPDTDMTRAMLAVILYNLEGMPENFSTSTFDDVENDMWYTKAINWANENNIIRGYNKEKFAPNESISREQVAIMLYRYAGSPELKIGKLDFQDANQVSEYAKKAMWWAIKNDIIEGDSSKNLRPQGKASRAEVATMLKRFIYRLAI